MPPKYYLTNEERWFKDKSLVKKLSIPPGEKRNVFVEVKQSGSVIQWEFVSKEKDIGFGLTFEEDNREIEVLPIIKFCTSDGTEKCSYKAQSTGKCKYIKY